MKIREFGLERYYGKYEFTTRFQLSASDCESVSIGQLLEHCGVEPRAFLEHRLGYTETRGAPELREAVAAHYPNCTAENVLVCNAPQEAIFLTMQAFLEPGDKVVVLTPCYPSLKEVARSIGCELVEWNVVESPDGWQLDLDSLSAHLNGAKLLVTNAPHNPTGLQPTSEQWSRIRALTDEHGVKWFSDEMYRGLERDSASTLTPACSYAPGAISLWGSSKSFGLPGLRIGWLVSHDAELLLGVEKLKDYTSICSNAPGEWLARIALENAPPILEGHRRCIAQNIALVEDFIARHERFSWFAPQAGPVGLMRLEGETATAHAERIRVEAEGLLVPTTLFDLDDAHLRIGLGRADFPQALERWDAVVGG